MTTTPPSVGDSIQSMCTKCRKPARHVIVSIVDGAAARVECTVCEGVHNYRSPPAKAPAKQRKPAGESKKATRSVAAATAAQEWETLVGSKDPSRAAPYRQEGARAPRAGDLLAHATFGVGLVRKIIPPNKADVLFREGVKRMVIAP